MLGKASPGRGSFCNTQEQPLFLTVETLSWFFFGLFEALLLQVKLMELDIPQVHICDPLEFIFPACQSPLSINMWLGLSCMVGLQHCPCPLHFICLHARL